MSGILISPWEEFANPPELIAFLVDPVKRLGYVYERLAVYAEATERGIPERVVNAASRLLCDGNRLAHWLRKRALGSPSKYESDFVSQIDALPMQMIGYVYFTRSPLRPSNIKIGFTTRIPEIRVKSLMANSGEKLELLGAFPGTLMDELIFHGLNLKDQVAGEWYSNPRWLPDVSFLREPVRVAA